MPFPEMRGRFPVPANRRNRNVPKRGAARRARGGEAHEGRPAARREPAAGRGSQGASAARTPGEERAGAAAGFNAGARAQDASRASAAPHAARQHRPGTISDVASGNAAGRAGRSTRARRTGKVHRAKAAYRPETPHQARKAPKSRVTEARPHDQAKRYGGTEPRAAVYTAAPGIAAADDLDFGPECPRRKVSYDRDGLHVPTSTGEVTFTRRQLLIGAGVAAGLVAAGGIAGAYQNNQREAASFDTLAVPGDQVITLDDLSQVKTRGRISRLGSYQLPYGTLMWCNSDNVAVCLLPTSKAKPLVTMALFSLSDGSTTDVLRRAKGQSEGFGVYDARCSDAGVVWVEENILTGAWRIYTAPLDGVSAGSTTKVDEGDSSTETPTIAAVGNNAFWQVMPPAPTDDSSAVDGQSVVRTAPFAAPASVQTVFTCDGRMSTPVSAGDGGVVITPAHEGTSSYCQMTLIDAAGQVLDALTLPSGMTPQNVGYGSTGFTFAFPDIYDYGDGISQLGTYAPTAKPSGGNYSGQTWFRFGRTPSQAACWCGPRLMVKSSRAVAGINLTDRTYFTLSLENGAQDYGDCLASMGAHKKLVTFQNVDNTEAQETGAASSTEQAKYCLVRVWHVSE
jgi:hypothetical protein